MKHLTLMLVFVSLCPSVHAWGKRGHQIVAENAAIVSSGEPESAFMRGVSFDFGFYSNVPDFIWKRPETYESEKYEHFMDLEIFERAFKERKESAHAAYEMSRKDFDAKFPEIKINAGRAFWRIRELEDKLKNVTAALKELKEDKGPARQKLQEKWIVLAGVLSHYVGDLSMPLHVSENYDGQMTDQRGIHSYFEEAMVDQLYPELASKVLTQAQAQWPAFKKKNAAKTLLQLVEAQVQNSLKDVTPLLKLDKGHARSGDRKDAKRYEAMMVRRMVDGTLTLAEIYRRNLGFKWDGNKFYFFKGEPEHIKPGAME